MKHFWYC